MPMDEDALIELAAGIVERARKRGADVAEAVARAGWELSTRVRLGEVELVEEAGHRSVSLRVIKSHRVASSATSDLSPEGLERLVSDAVELADLSEADEFAGPADPAELAASPHPDLDLFDATVDGVDAERAIAVATEAERAALASDPRLTLSEGATYSRVSGASAMVLSAGFVGAQRGSYASLVVSPVVEDTEGKKRRGFHFTAARHLAQLESPRHVGETAAKKTLAKLGARKVPTCEAAVVFDAEVARSILGTLAGCLVGGAVWRKSTYLLEREGTPVASSLVTVVDDPLMPRGPGSKPYDGEGLRTARRVVVSRGVLETFLLDCYAARKLDRRSTASAGRSGGSIGATTSNFVLQAGDTTVDDLVASTDRGLLVTEMMGFGFNPLTGDFSRGASGFWIEKGVISHPVGEVTISSNLDAMMKGIDAVANDLKVTTATASPTFRVARMTIAGT